jgi:hypothetical protein
MWSRALLLAALVWAAPAHARQLQYNAERVGASIAFQYVWKDRAGTAHAAAFQLPESALKAAQINFQGFDVDKAKAAAQQSLQAYASKPRADVRLRVNGSTISAEGVNKASLEREMALAKEHYKKALEDELYKAYFTRVDENSIMPDHTRIAQMNYAAVRPIAQALAPKMAQMTARERVNFLLGFVQSIPYDTLDSRNNGAGFVTPLQLIAANRGDCDSKSVLFVALLRHFYPNLRALMVYVPGHAFVGLDMPRDGTDFALQLGSLVAVLAEPVGPGLTALGQIRPESIQIIRQGQVSYREFDFLR